MENPTVVAPAPGRACARVRATGRSAPRRTRAAEAGAYPVSGPVRWRGWVAPLVVLGLADVAVAVLGATGLVLPARQGTGSGPTGAAPELVAAMLLLLVALAGHLVVVAVVVLRWRDLCAASSAGIAVLLDGAVVALSVDTRFWWPQVLYLVAGLSHLALLVDAVRALREDDEDPSPCRRAPGRRIAQHHPVRREERRASVPLVVVPPVPER